MWNLSMLRARQTSEECLGDLQNIAMRHQHKLFIPALVLQFCDQRRDSVSNRCDAFNTLLRLLSIFGIQLPDLLIARVASAVICPEVALPQLRRIGNRAGTFEHRSE